MGRFSRMFHGVLCRVNGHYFGEPADVEMVLKAVKDLLKARPESKISSMYIECALCSEKVDFREAVENQEQTTVA